MMYALTDICICMLKDPEARGFAVAVNRGRTVPWRLRLGFVATLHELGVGVPIVTDAVAELLQVGKSNR